MAEYIKSIGGAVIIAALTQMLVPEGSFQKYCRMVCGFMIIAAVLSPLTGGLPNIQTESMDMDAAEREARARILDKHRENLVKMIEEQFPETRAFVEVDEEGGVTKAAVENAKDEEAVKKYIEENFAIEEGKIKINENKGASDR